MPAQPPRRILFLSSCVRGGGAGWSLYYLLKHLDRERVEPLARDLHRAVRFFVGQPGGAVGRVDPGSQAVLQELRAGGQQPR